MCYMIRLLFFFFSLVERRRNYSTRIGSHNDVYFRSLCSSFGSSLPSQSSAVHCRWGEMELLMDNMRISILLSTLRTVRTVWLKLKMLSDIGG